MPIKENGFDAEKLHRQHVDEAIKEARIRADLLDRMYTEYSDKFMRESCARKADTLRTLCNEVERLRGLIGDCEFRGLIGGGERG